MALESEIRIDSEGIRAAAKRGDLRVTKTVSSQGAGIQGPYRAPVFYVDDAQNIVDGWFVSRRGAIVRVALCGRPGVTRTVHARYVFTRWAPT